MSTPDPPLGTPVRRRPGILTDPSEDELARYWSLSPADLREVSQCRGADHKRRFALQLCMVRAHGRFLDDYRQTPLRIVNHLSRQLELAPVLFLGPPEREPTEREQAQRIRGYLGLSAFDQGTAARLREWLRLGAAEGRSTAELLALAEGALRRWQIVLPAPGTLERIVNSAAAQAMGELFEAIAAHLPGTLREAIDLLLEVPPGDARSSLFRLKDYPRAPNAGVIKGDISRWRLIRDLLSAGTGLDGLDPRLVRQAGELGRRYDAGDLRRFAPAKRYTLVACYLFEARKTLLDHIVEMNDLFLTALARRSRHAVEKRRKLLRRQARDGLHRVLGAVDALIEADGGQTVAAFREAVEAPRLAQAAAACRAYDRLEQRGELDAVLSRYGTLRQYLPSFFELPFRAAPGSEPLLQAIEIARALDTGTRGPLTPEDPSDFVPAGWRAYLVEHGKLDRRIWEVALAFATRNALRAGSLFLNESREHVSFWNLIYDSRDWQEHRPHAYQQLDLPTSPQDFLSRLVADLERAARAAAAGLPRNPFAGVRDGRLRLKRRDALRVSRELRRLRETFRASYPRVRIEDLLQDVDEWCGFTRAFQPLGGYAAAHARDTYRSLLAALIAHGTNLGLAAMSQSVDDLTAEMLQDTTRWFLRDETLKAANAILVDYHHHLPLSRVWGDGSRSSSDGQRFAVQRDSLLGSVYPRYFGYYDRALAFYTHTADQHSVYATQVIACTPREAGYVLAGILENDSVLPIREHTSDTHGFTEHLFGLCALLGIQFMPRLKDLSDQVLSGIDRAADYGPLQPLFRNFVNLDLIAEQWDELVRLAASLKDRLSPAHVVMQRLINAPAADRLASALSHLGRLVKTIHILRYIHEEPLRQAIQLQLNRGEFRHILAKWLFFANQGELRSGDYEEVMNKASCLSLLSNAVLVWNAVHMTRILTRLRAAGQQVDDEDLARVSPLAHAHVIASGSYFQSPRRRADAAPELVPA
ncbi:MAG: Tn3 family transposase [Alphaproteobacteria bacterium]|nr:Tn3 family transposase [Alphaproteobacteria bacterium]